MAPWHSGGMESPKLQFFGRWTSFAQFASFEVRFVSLRNLKLCGPKNVVHALEMVLEQDPSHQRINLINFFCDWKQHPHLMRGVSRILILKGHVMELRPLGAPLVEKIDTSFWVF